MQRVAAGEVAVYHHVITNTGNVTDPLDLEVEIPSGWEINYVTSSYTQGTTIWLPTSLTAGMTLPLQIELRSPATAPSGYYTSTITATLLSSPTVSVPFTEVTYIQERHIYLPLIMRIPPPPAWQQSVGTAGMRFDNLVICDKAGGTQTKYASMGADNGRGIYRWDNSESGWQQWAMDGMIAVEVVVDPKDCNTAYVATWGNGVYKVTGQNQAESISQNVGDLDYLYGLAISPDADGSTLYAGTYNSGVYKTATANINWQNTLPDERIRSLTVIDSDLYAGARACSFYRLSGGSWLGPITVSGCTGDAQVWSIAKLADGTLFVGLGDNGLYRTTGTTILSQNVAWQKVPAIPNVDVYGLASNATSDSMYVSAYGAGVYVCDAMGSCSPQGNPGLGTVKVRGITYDFTLNHLYVTSDDGIWYVEPVD